METLNDSNQYEVHPDDVDVRGWEVTSKDHHLGIVDDLVLDTYNMRVKYLDLIKKDSIVESHDHFLIPVDQVVLDRLHKKVKLNIDPYHFHNHYPGYTDDVPEDYEEQVRGYFLENYAGEYPDDNSKIYDREGTFHSKGTVVEGRGQSPYGSEYERIKNNPENWDRKIEALERQKQLKQIEMERDIALIDEEINQIRENAGQDNQTADE